MINFFLKRLIKRAGLTPEHLQDLVERGTKDLDQLSETLDVLEKNGQSIKTMYEDMFAETAADLRTARENAGRKRAEQAEKARRAKQLDDMLQTLRPGMHIRELDRITSLFGEEYTAKALRNPENWLGTVRGKCVIDYDTEGVLTRVHFSGATDDTAQIAQTKEFGRVLQTCAGTLHADDLEVHDESLLRAVELATNTPNLTILAWFWNGRFHGTTYLTPSERARMADGIAGMRPPAPAKPKAQPGKGQEQRDADTALRKVYYALADQEGDETYRELVEWLISETSPDARHYQLGFNWDHGFHIPFWIIRQPDTYLATALKAFELGQAQYWLAQPKTEDPGSDFAYELNERIRDGFYAAPETDDQAIAYKPTLNLDKSSPEEAAALQKIVAPQVFTPLSGRGEHLIYCDVPEKFIDYLT